MVRSRDESTGKFEEVYSDEQILDLLRETRLGTSEVADRLECHRTTAHEKLVDLQERDYVESTKVGNTLMWKLADEEES